MKTKIKLSSKKIKKCSGRKKNSRFKNKKYSRLRGGSVSASVSVSNVEKKPPFVSTGRYVPPSRRGSVVKPLPLPIVNEVKHYIPRGTVYTGEYTGFNTVLVPEIKGLERKQSPEFKQAINRYYNAINIFNILISLVYQNNLKSFKDIKNIKDNFELNKLIKKLEYDYLIKIILLTNFIKIIFFNPKHTDKIIETIYIYYEGNNLITIEDINKSNTVKLNSQSIPLRKITFTKQKIYVVKEQTNQNITIEIDPKLQLTYSFTPLDLNVDIMQLALKKFDVIPPSTQDSNTYLSFNNNFPSLIIKNALFSFKSSREGSEWFSVYEDSTFDPNTTFIVPHSQNYDKQYEEDIIYEQYIFRNIDLFNSKKEEIKKLISSYNVNNDNDELQLKLDKIYKHAYYCFIVKIKMDKLESVPNEVIFG